MGAFCLKCSPGGDQSNHLLLEFLSLGSGNGAFLQSWDWAWDFHVRRWAQGFLLSSLLLPLVACSNPSARSRRRSPVVADLQSPVSVIVSACRHPTSGLPFSHGVATRVHTFFLSVVLWFCLPDSAIPRSTNSQQQVRMQQSSKSQDTSSSISHNEENHPLRSSHNHLDSGPPTAAQAQDPVVDVGGFNLAVLNDYYMAPKGIIDGGPLEVGGVLTFDNTGSCPLNVIQERIPWWYGRSWRLYPAERSSDGLVHVSSDLHILSNLPSGCPELPAWTVHPDAGTANALAIQTGCKPRIYFRIEPVSPPIYKLTTISRLSDEDLVITPTDLIIREEGEKRQLFANNGSNSSPFLIVFTRFSPRVAV